MKYTGEHASDMITGKSFNDRTPVYGGCHRREKENGMSERLTAIPQPCEEAARLATLVVDWMSDQKYCGEEILHAVVCCDFASRTKFIMALARKIESWQGPLDSGTPQAEREQPPFEAGEQRRAG